MQCVAVWCGVLQSLDESAPRWIPKAFCAAYIMSLSNPTSPSDTAKHRKVLAVHHICACCTCLVYIITFVNVVYVIIIVKSNSLFLIHTYTHDTFPSLRLLPPPIYIHTPCVCIQAICNNTHYTFLPKGLLPPPPKGAPAATYIGTHPTQTPEQIACIHTPTGTDCNKHTHTPVHVTLGLQHGHCRSRCLPSCLFGLCQTHENICAHIYKCQAMSFKIQSYDYVSMLNNANAAAATCQAASLVYENIYI